MSIADIKNFILELDRTQFYRAVAIFFALFCILLGGMFFLQRRSVGKLQARLQRINQQRQEARAIIQEHALINQQRAAVDALLAKDKNFKLPQYFDLLIKELGLGPEMSKTWI
jgi:hypothetical protein